MMYEWMDGHWGWGGMLFGPLVFVLFIGLIVYLVVLLARSGGRSESQKSPLEILEERYARGDIDTKEFEERRSRLQGGQ